MGTQQNNIPSVDLRVREVFLSVVEETTDEQRSRVLAELCGSDETLRKAVERLLASEQALGPFVETGGAAAWGVAETVGPYRIREQIGEGGMGVVYVAEQTTPVQRKVALKIIGPGMASKDVVARFEAERQALAMMDHPNIARVFDGGATATGKPYFVMELVQGPPITEYCDAQRLSTRERLDLFRQVCQAVQHAHQKGIIHRDLKPTNVLVSRIDGVAVPKVIDFGVAKAVGLGMKLSQHTVYTHFAQMVGTPLYMSPEQTEPGVVDVDTRSDVYSLGVLLYELLTGSTPLDRDALKQAGFDEMRRMICEQEPPRPSIKISTLKADALSTVSEQRRSDPRTLHNSLHGELDWLVMKALEKDRNRRYASASELSDDVGRYLTGDAIHAHPPSRLYQVRKIVRRHRAAFATIAAFFLLLLGSVVGISWQMLRAMDAERVAETAMTEAQLEAARANKQFQRAEDERLHAIDSLKVARNVVDNLYMLVGTRWIADETAPSTFQQGILTSASTFYEQLAESPVTRPGNLSELSLVASGYDRIGNIQHYLQNYDEAIEARQKEIAVIRQALEYAPENMGIHSGMSEAQYNLGTSLTELARFDEANEAFHEASTIAAELAQMGIDPFKSHYWIARAELASAVILANKGSIAEAARLARTAKDNLIATAQEHGEGADLPGDLRVDFDIDRRRAYLWLARTLAYDGSVDEAMKICEREHASCRRQRTIQQDETRLRTLEIEYQQLAAELAGLRGHFATAAEGYLAVLDMRRKSLRSGVAPLQFLHESFFKHSLPSDGMMEPGQFCDYVETQLRLAIVLRQVDRPYAAENQLGECIAVTAVLVAERPNSLRYRIADANVWTLAAELIAESRPAEAEILYRRARQVWAEVEELFPTAKNVVSGVFGFTSDWNLFQEIGRHFAHVAVAETDEQEVPTSETVFSLNANAHAWARVSLWENAIRDFERSVQLRTTDDAYDWLQLAIAYANLGQHEKAQEWLDRSEASISQGSSPNVELAELYDIARATVNDKQAIQE